MTNPEPHRGTRSIKALTTTREVVAHQRDWFSGVARQVRDDGVPLALVNADAPHELLRAMGVPYVVNQWWASVCAAKQHSADYLQLLRHRGYPDDQDQYSALALASSFEPDPTRAPWGGLPTPSLVVAQLTGDAIGKIFELWAREHGAIFYPLEYTIGTDAVEPRWFDHIHHDWERVIEPQRLDLMVDELRGLIRVLEDLTGRTFDEAAFRDVMALANEQAEYNRGTRDLLARTTPAPVGIADIIPSVMIPQWHRGSEWGRNAARRLYAEVRARVDAGSSAVAEERVRLMWIGRGLWFDMGFYQHVEQQYGAVFVWSMYLAVAADCYLRYGEDPLRTLAARFCVMSELFNMPPWSSEWYCKEARHNGIDGVVHLTTDAVRGSPFITHRLEQAGVPVLEIGGDNVDARSWDDEAIRRAVGDFIEQRAAPRAQARRGRDR